MNKPIAKFRTSGNGLWSKRVDNTGIAIEGMHLYVRKMEDDEWSSLDVQYSPDDWKVTEDGLIYTDDRWIADLKEFLIDLGFSKTTVDEIEYSEAGMQGKDFVNFDVPNSFAAEADPFYRFVAKKPSINWLKITKETL